ncbi:DUF488 domain-containing protein [Leptospira ellisii]|uniref:DUF488 domain-containing protein n=1 Tax=Leptospira ellisii TaxID=2023197 RepID=A0A2N0B8G1_9LEPT|nr:DUF488 domain-containing protein [Leptospira ellisii]MDV6237535.1 DUF488 domain-containing protein [Leptospira ellisii]PJZ92816.1 hypothetical protein CH379_11200 [Leptospira ellisii]PKA05186.1 hypothetical protein CH375_06550 [Leptospira ellisii]
MKIYTSYFGNARKLPEEILPISIARYARYWGGLKFLPLAPDSDTLKMEIQEYTKRYADKLSKLEVGEVLEELKALSQGKNIALLCYEKPGDFCHRRLVAEWIERETGIEVPEYQVLKKEETNKINLQ